MNSTKPKATTSKTSTLPQTLPKQEAFLNNVVAVVMMDHIPPELILKWDQTGILLVPASTWTMDREGSRQLEIVGASDKRQIMEVLCWSLTGMSSPPHNSYIRRKPDIAILNMCSSATGT